MAIVMPELAFDAIRNASWLTHFASVILRSHVAASGLHCKRTNTKKAACVVVTSPIKAYRKIFPVRFCWNRRSKNATLILMEAMARMPVGTERAPNLTTLSNSDRVRNDLDDGATGPITAKSKPQVAIAKACQVLTVRYTRVFLVVFLLYQLRSGNHPT